MSKNIGYHTRLYTDNTRKIVGGSFGGQIDAETVERLVNLHFEVFVKPSGRAVFVDQQGREVHLYLSVDPENTEKGKNALTSWRRRRNAELEANRERMEAEEAEVESLLAGLSHDEIVRRLKGLK